MLPESKNRADSIQALAGKRPYLELRAKIIQAIRDFFTSLGFLEIETPLILTSPAPELHIEPISTENGVLQTSPELCMKRLLASGYTKVFQICKCFRKGERGRMHLPEFTILEWYAAGSNYFDLMDTCEDLIMSILKGIGKANEIVYRGHGLDLSKPWKRISMKEAFRRHTRLDLLKVCESGMFDQIFVREVEPHLGFPGPQFVYDYPASDSAMAKAKEQDERFAERFELYIGGVEIANGFSELNDSFQQKARFEKVLEKRRKTGLPCWPLPEPFLAALEHMPEAAGIALGIDRLIMVLADVGEIDRIVAFTPEEV